MGHTVPGYRRASDVFEGWRGVVGPVSRAGGHHVQVVYIVDREVSLCAGVVGVFETGGIEGEDRVVGHVGGGMPGLQTEEREDEDCDAHQLWENCGVHRGW